MPRPVLLALRPLGLGDLCTAVPALRALRRAHPEHRLLLACEPVLRDLARWTGAVDDVLPARPLEPLQGVHRPDVAVDLHGRGPASQRILVATRPHRLIAFRNDEVPATRHLPPWIEDEHEVRRWCRLVAACGCPADASDLDLGVPESAVASGHGGFALVHPGAASPARRWPAERFAAVARHLRHHGLNVVVSGGAAEIQLARAVHAAAPGSRLLAGATTPMDMLALTGRAQLVVCGDTGVAHLATATRTPSVVLFGPTPPSRWGPPANRSAHRVLWRGMHGDPHADRVDRGLSAIETAEVLHVVDELLAVAAPALA
jgi:ADP-heptose:LPS heptosyltransferase